MPLFSIINNQATQLRKQNFRDEKQLQVFVQNNLDQFFKMQFLATEFTTSSRHAGRIDTLALDENGSPVIIEYKWGEKDNIINQGLFYLDWLVDHTADFKLLVQSKLGNDVDIDFGSPRLILVAASFSKYDQYAINRMAENIELWSYSLYENDLFELRLVAESQATNKNGRNQVSKVNYEDYSVESLLKDKSQTIQEIFQTLREKILDLETEVPIQENPRKHYIAYKTNHNFTSLQLQKSQIKVFISLTTEEIGDTKLELRNMRNVGHYGTGHTQITLIDYSQLDEILMLIKKAYENSN